MVSAALSPSVAFFGPISSGSCGSRPKPGFKPFCHPAPGAGAQIGCWVERRANLPVGPVLGLGSPPDRWAWAKPARRTAGRARQDISGLRRLDPIAQAGRIAAHRALDPLQQMARMFIQPSARDILAAGAEALEQGRRLAGIGMGVAGNDGLADRRLARQADDQGKQSIHRGVTLRWAPLRSIKG